MSTALLLLPDFALILIGTGLAHTLLIERGFWDGLERLVYLVLFPSLLFASIARARLDVPGLGTAVGVAAGATLVGIALAFGLMRMRLAARLTSASCGQCAFRFNAYVALALASRLYGEAGLAITALMVAVVVPMANLAAVSMLARGAGRSVWKEVVRNPLILATLGGLAFNLAGADLPRPAWQVIDRLAGASLALGLIAVGAGLRFRAMQHLNLMVAILSVKHLAMPLAALALASLAGLSGVALGTAVMFAAYPTASSAYILASRMGGDAEATAATVSLSTLAGMLTLPVWVALLAR